MVTDRILEWAPQFFAVDPPEYVPPTSVTSEDAYILMGVEPVTDNPHLTARKLYRVVQATMAERLALMKPGNRICSW